MFNLLGEMPRSAVRQPADPTTMVSVHWHDYKKTARINRKIGHVTITAKSEAGLRARAAQLASDLGVAAELNLEAVMHGVNSLRA
jgi:5-(carboxyamino)imidazole ribonucleotide synthase